MNKQLPKDWKWVKLGEVYEPNHIATKKHPLQLGDCFRFSSSGRKKENHSCTG